MIRHVLGNAIHRFAHRVDPAWMCECAVVAYTRSWKHAHEAQEKRAQLIRSGVSVESADRFEAWLRENAR